MVATAGGCENKKTVEAIQNMAFQVRREIKIDGVIMTVKSVHIPGTHPSTNKAHQSSDKVNWQFNNNIHTVV